MPSPQRGRVQALVQPSSAMALPSSHSSAPADAVATTREDTAGVAAVAVDVVAVIADLDPDLERAIATARLGAAVGAEVAVDVVAVVTLLVVADEPIAAARVNAASAHADARVAGRPVLDGDGLAPVGPHAHVIEIHAAPQSDRAPQSSRAVDAGGARDDDVAADAAVEAAGEPAQRER
jgi:hypothetical protein